MELLCINQFIVRGKMDKRQLKFRNYDMFTPWNDEQEQEIYKLNSKIISEEPGEKKQQTKRLRKKKGINAEAPITDDSIEKQAKKTLLDLDLRDKSENLRHLQEYLVKKSRIKELEHEQEKEKRFKLPVINQEKRQRDIDSGGKAIRNSRSLVMPTNKINPDNQEEDIFKKYGQHRKISNQVERTISYGSNINHPRNIKEVIKKYSTIDSSRQLHEYTPQLNDLKLRGKKYSYDSRNKSRGKIDAEISYLPSQPNITPLYLLFGQEKKDIFKKVFQQIQHRIK